eukprot:TRINITY_DN81_c0_g2_i4.p1 TRINITY_DN81_c0_g2~~TRINITY_DN81_c0_g2_i4.p1  ORF type:complete len:791 (+),score=234.57 TRINITY_DN81_c0_g2_i4:116-2488(+)
MMTEDSSGERRPLLQAQAQAPAAAVDVGEAAPLLQAPPEAEAKRKSVSLVRLFRHSDAWDKLLILVGFVFAALQGGMMPSFSLVFGRIINAFQPVFPNTTSSYNSSSSSSSSSSSFTGTGGLMYAEAEENFTIPSSYDVEVKVDMQELRVMVYIMFGMAGACLIIAFVHTFCFSLAALRQSNRIRQLYFKAVLAQEMGWHDTKKAGELSARMGSDTQKIQEALGEKVGQTITFLGTFVAGWTVGFVKGWQMALVIVSVTPLLIVSAGIMGVVMRKFTARSQDEYAKAGGVAEEVIACIHTVTAFGLQEREAQRYNDHLDKSKSVGMKKGFIAGGSLGIVFFLMFCSYGLAFWYGSRLIYKGDMDAGKVTTVFFAIMMGAMSLGQAAPNFQTFAEGQGAAAEIFSVIDRRSQLDPFSRHGTRPPLSGQIAFNDVHFTYPTRQEAEVLHGFTLTIESGKTVALVGQSGCGKSTVVQMIERLYTPTSGTVTMDGNDVAEINIQHLRSQIGMVGQEPVLFAMSIRDNIALGCDRQVTMDEIIGVAQQANAHDFICRLPKQYDTFVGERGVQLSGGQKQRIAIARALIKNPKILLLDEATSALDSESEAAVHDALDRAKVGRTCVLVAHRLSTVRDADVIAVLSDGHLAETGTHEQLLAAQGIYYGLLRRQVGIDSAAAAANVSPSPSPSLVTSPRRRTKAAERGSLHVDSEKKQEEEEVKEKVSFGVVLRTFGMMRSTWFVLIIALIIAVLNGCLFPSFAYVFSEMMNTLVELTPLNYDDEKVQHTPCLSDVHA